MPAAAPLQGLRRGLLVLTVFAASGTELGAAEPFIATDQISFPGLAHTCALLHHPVNRIQRKLKGHDQFDLVAVHNRLGNKGGWFVVRRSVGLKIGQAELFS